MNHSFAQKKPVPYLEASASNAKIDSEIAPLVCTVLPTYNERDNIRPLIAAILDNAITPHTVVVVDDNSPDGTWQVVTEVAAAYAAKAQGDLLAPRVVLHRRLNARGLTSAIQHGIDAAIDEYNAAIVTWMDCDLSMPPQDIPALLRPIINEEADIAVGSRWIEGGADVAHGRMARTLSWLINRFAIMLLGRQVHDYTSGFLAVRAHVLRNIRLQGDYGEYCIDLLGQAVRKGYRVVEVPYICVPRQAGVSKTGVDLWDYLVKGRKYIATVWRLYWQS